jgi:hypothetical protein
MPCRARFVRNKVQKRDLCVFYVLTVGGVEIVK